MRLGLFGGTFDPIHEAHLAVARAAAQAFNLDRVLLIPAAVPPHKAGAHASYTDRLNMVKLAVANDAQLSASDLEADTERSYSIKTIERVRANLLTDDELFFIIGVDAFADIDTWYRKDDVMRQVTFIVVSRPGFTAPVPPGARVLWLDSLAIPVSSSAVRAALGHGVYPDELPAGVSEYIREHRLYLSF